jgi:hypothetical protein
VSICVGRIEREKRIKTAIGLLAQVPDNSSELFPQPSSLGRTVNYLIDMNYDDAMTAIRRYAETTKHRNNLETVAHLLLDANQHDIPKLANMRIIDGVLVPTDLLSIAGMDPPNPNNVEIFETTIKHSHFRKSPITIAEDPIPIFREMLENIEHFDGLLALRGLGSEVGIDVRSSKSIEDFNTKLLNMNIRLNHTTSRYEIVD